jgi:hypothetical protein
MKPILLFIAAMMLIACCAAQASTPPKTNSTNHSVVVVRQNPGVLILSKIESERTNLTTRSEAMAVKLQEDRRVLELKRQAQKISARDFARQDTAIRDKYASDTAPIGKRIAELNLQEYEVRKSYNLPAPEKPRKRK